MGVTEIELECFTCRAPRPDDLPGRRCPTCGDQWLATPPTTRRRALTAATGAALVVVLVSALLISGAVRGAATAPTMAPTTTDASGASSGGSRILARAPATPGAPARRDGIVAVPVVDDAELVVEEPTP